MTVSSSHVTRHVSCVSSCIQLFARHSGRGYRVIFLFSFSLLLLLFVPLSWVFSPLVLFCFCYLGFFFFFFSPSLFSFFLSFLVNANIPLYTDPNEPCPKKSAVVSYSISSGNISGGPDAWTFLN